MVRSGNFRGLATSTEHAPGGNGFPTNPVYFDTYGWTFRLGARAKF